MFLSTSLSTLTCFQEALKLLLPEFPLFLLPRTTFSPPAFPHTHTRPPKMRRPGRGVSDPPAFPCPEWLPQPRQALCTFPQPRAAPSTLLFTFPSFLLLVGHEKRPGAQLSTRAPQHRPQSALPPSHPPHLLQTLCSACRTMVPPGTPMSPTFAPSHACH